MVTTRVKDVLWHCVICERVIEGKADQVAVCSGSSAVVEKSVTDDHLNTTTDFELFAEIGPESEEHVPIEMEPT